MDLLAAGLLDGDFTLSGRDVLVGVLATLAYAAVGLLLLVAGYVLLDKLTPGDLGSLIYRDGNTNAARMVVGHLVAVTLVVVSATLTSAGGTFGALLDVAVFGALALVLQAVSFKVLDAVTPGHLGTIVTAKETCPASLVTAVWAVAIGAVLAVAIV